MLIWIRQVVMEMETSWWGLGIKSIGFGNGLGVGMRKEISVDQFLLLLAQVRQNFVFNVLSHSFLSFVPLQWQFFL